MGVLKRIERRKKSKIKKALKSYRGRFWKNLAIFMAGVFSSGFILAGVSAIILKFVPVKNVTGGNTDKVVSSELADKSILDVLVGFSSATVDDYVIVTTLIDTLQNAKIAGKKISDFVYIDTAKLSGTKLLELGPAIKNALTVTATLYSTVGAENLNKYGIGKITAFNEFLPVIIDVDGAEGEEDTTKHATVSDIVSTEDLKANLYYYKVADGVTVEGSIVVSDGDYKGVYARAFNDDKSLKNGVTNDTLLYYAAATKIPITDAVTVLPDAFGRVKATELLELFGSGIEDENSIFGNLLGDRTVKELTNLTLEEVMVGDLLDVEESDVLYKILTDALGDWDTISIGALTNITNEQLNSVKVSTFLSEPDQMLVDVFTQITGEDDWADITIGSLSNLDEDGFNSITLSTFLGKDNDTLDLLYKAMAGDDKPASANDITLGHIKNNFNIDYVPISEFVEADSDIGKMIDSAFPSKDFEDITLGDLSSKDPETNKPLLDIENINLSTIMIGVDDEDMLAQVLVELTGATSWDNVTISSVSNIENFDGVKLSTVMGGSVPEDIENILRQAYSVPEGQELTVGTLNGTFTPNNISLSTVMPDIVPSQYDEYGNKTQGNMLADILLEINGKTADEWDDLKVANITSFNNIDGVKLSTVLSREKASELADILDDLYHAEDADGKSYEDLTIQDLGTMHFDAIHLNTVLPKTEMDEILINILEDEFGSYEEITISSLKGFELGKLHLYKIMPEDDAGEDFAKILVEIVPGASSYEDIYVTDLYGLDVTKVSISTLLDEKDLTNPILKKLAKDNVTIANIGSAMNNLKLYDVYGENIFVEITSQTTVPAGAQKYKNSGDTYTRVANNDATATHYLNKENAGIWLLLCFNASGFDADTTLGKPQGVPKVYTKADTSFEALEGSGLSSKFTSATIGQLVDAGILSNTINENLYRLTIDMALTGTNS